jgi:circadian clock protein KaiB
VTIHPQLEKREFLLFVFRDSLESNRAIANLRRIGEEALSGDYRLEIVDVLEDPEAAELNAVVTTPTLIQKSPWPKRHVSVDLSSYEGLMAALDLGPPQIRARSRALRRAAASAEADPRSA